MSLSLAYWWIAAHIGATALGIGNYGTLPIIIIGVICIGLVFKAADLAQNLGGAVTSASGSAMLGGMVGGAIGGTLGSLNLAKSGVNTTGSLVGLGKSILGLTKGAGTADSSAVSVMKDVGSELKKGE